MVMADGAIIAESGGYDKSLVAGTRSLSLGGNYQGEPDLRLALAGVVVAAQDDLDVHRVPGFGRPLICNRVLDA